MNLYYCFLRNTSGHITLQYLSYVISGIYIKEKIVIVSNDYVNWNGEFNKIKPNIKGVYYKELFNNFINDLIQLSRLQCTRSSINNIKDKIYIPKVTIKRYERIKCIMKSTAIFMI